MKKNKVKTINFILQQNPFKFAKAKKPMPIYIQF